VVSATPRLQSPGFVAAQHTFSFDGSTNLSRLLARPECHAQQGKLQFVVEIMNEKRAALRERREEGASQIIGAAFIGATEEIDDEGAAEIDVDGIAGINITRCNSEIPRGTLGLRSTSPLRTTGPMQMIGGDLLEARTWSTRRLEALIGQFLTLPWVPPKFDSCAQANSAKFSPASRRRPRASATPCWDQRRDHLPHLIGLAVCDRVHVLHDVGCRDSHPLLAQQEGGDRPSRLDSLAHLLITGHPGEDGAWASA